MSSIDFMGKKAAIEKNYQDPKADSVPTTKKKVPSKVKRKTGRVENLSNMGKGRPKGVMNKINKQLKDMILGALDDAGGQDYLTQQAQENPVAFLTLLGKVLPTTIKAEGGDISIAVLLSNKRKEREEKTVVSEQ